jgi:hypothetical protein
LQGGKLLKGGVQILFVDENGLEEAGIDGGGNFNVFGYDSRRF